MVITSIRGHRYKKTICDRRVEKAIEQKNGGNADNMGISADFSTAQTDIRATE